LSGEHVSRLKRRTCGFLKAAEKLIKLLDEVVRDVKLGF